MWLPPTSGAAFVSPLLPRFVAVAGGLILVQLPFAVLRGHRTTVTRSLTLLAILAAVALALAFAPWGFALLCAVLLALTVREAGLPAPAVVPAVAGFAVLILTRIVLAWPLVWLPAAFGLATVVLARRHPAAAASGYPLVALVVVPGAAALALVAVRSPAPAMALILLVQLNDAIGYLVGSAVGRHRPLPSISPNKSVEGYLAGALAAAGGLALMHTALLPLRAGAPLVADLALGAYVVVAADLGDLALSAIKRARGVKDFGARLPGHGGVLDRFGNLFMAAPLFALLWPLR